MKNRVLSLAAVAGFALLAFSLVSIAQPVTGGGGLSRVQVEGGMLEGSGTSTSKLRGRTDCSSNQVLKWDGDSWECATAGSSNDSWTQISPAAISGTVNDWNPTGLSTASTVVISTSGPVSLTGLAGGAAGRRIRLYNDGSNNVSLLNNNAGSSAGNKFVLTAFGGVRTLVGNEGCSVDLEYKGTFWSEVGFSCTDWVEHGKLFANDEFRAYSTASFFGGSNTFGDATTDTFSFIGNTTVGDFRGASITPTNTGTQNDYNPTNLATARIVLLNPASSLTITGLQGGTAGRLLTLCNESTNAIQLAQESGSSTAGNRLRFPGAAGINIPATNYWGSNGHECVELLYDGGLSRWVVNAWATSSVASFEATSQLYAANQFTSVVQATFLGNGTMGNDTGDTFNFATDAVIKTGDTRGNTVSPSALSLGNTNDYNPTNLARARILRITGAGDPGSVLTGLQGGADGRLMTICRAGGTLKISHEDTNSTAANRFTLLGATVAGNTIDLGGCLDFIYNGTASRWEQRAIGRNALDQSVRDLSASGAVAASGQVSGGSLLTLGNLTFNGNGDFGNAEADQINIYGKPYTRGTAPSVSACGTGATLAYGNDKAGKVNLGTGSVTSCTLTFNSTWTTNAPICTANSGNVNVYVYVSSVSTTSVVFGTSATTASIPIYYRCVGVL